MGGSGGVWIDVVGGGGWFLRDTLFFGPLYTYMLGKTWCEGVRVYTGTRLSSVALERRERVRQRR